MIIDSGQIEKECWGKGLIPFSPNYDEKLNLRGFYRFRTFDPSFQGILAFRQVTFSIHVIQDLPKYWGKYRWMRLKEEIFESFLIVLVGGGGQKNFSLADFETF